MNIKHLLNINLKDKIDEIPDEEKVDWGDFAIDDVSGKILYKEGARNARVTEMQYINDKGVWHVVDKSWVMAEGIPIVGTRWIDVDKGDARCPNLRTSEAG